MPFPEPIPDAIVDGNGIFVIPEMQSPDFAYGINGVTGWKLQADPSKIWAHELFADYIPFTVPRIPTSGKVNLLYKNSIEAQYCNSQYKICNDNASTQVLSTTATQLGGSATVVSIPNLVDINSTFYVKIHFAASMYIPSSTTSTTDGRIRPYVSYNSGVTWSSLGSAVEIVFQGNHSGTPTKWFTGSTFHKFTPTQTASNVWISLFGLAGANSQWTVNLDRTRMLIEPEILWIDTGDR